MKEKLNKELSQYIKIERFKKQYTQKIMARSLGISQKTYSLWEKYPIKLSLDDLIKIGNILDVNILIFFNNYIANCKEELNI